VKAGSRAIMLYVIQRSDGTIFKPAYEIDLAYGSSLKEVHKQGVEILVYHASVSPEKIGITTRIDYKL
jgi:sugar fermentation stimulation protein A